MDSGGRVIVHLAKLAAERSRTEPAALRAAALPRFMPKYRGVHFRRRYSRYGSAIWHNRARRILWLGSYKTPEEAAYAWDAAARIIRGDRAKPNFPELSPARAAPPPVVTELSLALQPATEARRRVANWRKRPASAAAAPHHHQQRAPAAAALLQRQPAVPPFTQFFCLAEPASAAGNAAAAVSVDPPVPAMPGTGAAYVLTAAELNAPMPFLPAKPTSSAQSSTEPVDTSLSLSLSAAAPTDQHRKRKLPVFLAGGSDQAVVGDNFTNGGASSSSAALPPVPPLRLKDLLAIDLFGRGGLVGAQ